MEAGKKKTRTIQGDLNDKNRNHKGSENNLTISSKTTGQQMPREISEHKSSFVRSHKGSENNSTISRVKRGCREKFQSAYLILFTLNVLVLINPSTLFSQSVPFGMIARWNRVLYSFRLFNAFFFRLHVDVAVPFWSERHLREQRDVRNYKHVVIRNGHVTANEH